MAWGWVVWGIHDSVSRELGLLSRLAIGKGGSGDITLGKNTGICAPNPGRYLMGPDNWLLSN